MTPPVSIRRRPTIRNENSIETVLPELNNNKNHRWGVNWSRHTKHLFAGKITKDDKINVTSKVGKKSECVKIRGDENGKKSMEKISKKQLEKILAEHILWRKGIGGAKANLFRTDLSGTDLSGIDLSGAD